MLETNTKKVHSDVLVAPHHGSKTSSIVGVVQEVGAKHIIFTLGYLNRFKHPKPIIEKRYEDSGAWLYHSDYSGALLIDLTRKTNVQIRAWRQAQQLYWHDNYHLSEN